MDVEQHDAGEQVRDVGRLDVGRGRESAARRGRASQ